MTWLEIPVPYLPAVWPWRSYLLFLSLFPHLNIWIISILIGLDCEVFQLSTAKQKTIQNLVPEKSHLFWFRYCSSGIWGGLRWAICLFHEASVELAGAGGLSAWPKYALIGISALVLPGLALSSSRVESRQTFPIKGQRVNILGFESHMISVTTIQLCHCRMKRTIDDNVSKWAWLCFNKTLWHRNLNFIYILHITKYSFDFFPLTIKKCKNHS